MKLRAQCISSWLDKQRELRPRFSVKQISWTQTGPSAYSNPSQVRCKLKMVCFLMIKMISYRLFWQQLLIFYSLYTQIERACIDYHTSLTYNYIMLVTVFSLPWAIHDANNAIFSDLCSHHVFELGDFQALPWDIVSVKWALQFGERREELFVEYVCFTSTSRLLYW